MHQLNEENWLTIAATFQQAFPETLVLCQNLKVSYPVIGLVGRKNEREWEAQELAACFDNIPPATLERDPLLKSARVLVAGVLKQDELKDRKINTLDNLQIEISAGNFWILKDLRKNRKAQYESEFLSGENLIEFNNRLRNLVEPVLPPKYFQQFKDEIESEILK